MSVGSGSVRWRVIVRKPLSRILTATVPARTPADRSRPATPSAIAEQRPLDDLRVARVDVERVLVADRLGRIAVVDRVGIDARERESTSDAPCLPNRRTSEVRRRAPRGRRSSGPSSRASATAVFSPTPHSRPIGSGARKAASSPSGTTTSPSGLRRSDAILATSFVLATPTEAVSPTSARTSSLIRRAIVGPSPNSAADPVTSRNASSIEIGSTSGV